MRESSAQALSLPPAAPEGPGAGRPPLSEGGGALEWALAKADASLDEIEANPPAIQKAMYDIATGALPRRRAATARFPQLAEERLVRSLARSHTRCCRIAALLWR